nr:hypothetical protein [Tanacetum cinerariifolium]
MTLKNKSRLLVASRPYTRVLGSSVIEPNELVSINSIIKSKDVISNENRFSSVPKPSLRIPNRTENISGSVVPEEVTKEISFLNGEIEEEVYMNQPKGFIMSENENKVCKLIKSLYGLKQAPKQLHQKFDEVDLSIGYLLYQADKCVYSKVNETVSTPIDTSKKVMPNNGQAVSQLEYSMVIGFLMYSMTCTRPGIAFAVGKLSKYTRYIDASWIRNTEYNSSTSGWVVLFSGGEISWASKKQTCIISSIMKSEFVALTAASKEAKWLRNMILKILLWSNPIAPISIRCDSAATLAKAYSQMYKVQFIPGNGTEGTECTPIGVLVLVRDEPRERERREGNYVLDAASDEGLCFHLRFKLILTIFQVNLGEATYIFGIKITRDRSKGLIAFSQSAIGSCLWASESAFLTSGRVLSIRRTRLTPASLEMCMCLKDHLDAKERKQDKCPLEIPLDFEEDIFDDEVQQNEAISLSDEEIALDANASSESTLSPGGPWYDYMMSSEAEDDY